MLYCNSSLASQEYKTLCTVLNLLFLTSKTVNTAPSLAQYGPCLPHTSLSLIHHVTASRHNDGLSSVSWRTPPFFSLQSPGERLFPLSSLSTWPFPSCPSGLPQRSHVVTAQFKFPWHPLPFLHSTLLSYNSEIIRLISTSTLGASLVAQRLKRLPAMSKTRLRSLGWEDPLEKEMATHSSILAERIPWREEPGRLQSTES